MPRWRLIVATAGVVALAGWLVWRCRRDDARVERAGSAVRAIVASRPWRDPALLRRGSIAGTVSDQAGRPVAGAHVCASGSSRELGTEPFRTPTCVTTDARGAYTLTGLLPARYAVGASARGFLPALDAREGGIALAEAERVAAVALVLRTGGVELTGVVADVTAGPIAHARVTAAASSSLGESAAVTVEADDQGRFALWVAPGAQNLTAAADGYADANAAAQAPGNATLRLTPEATIEGVVVDAATGAPVEGARVGIAPSDWPGDTEQIVVSDARGVFRFARLLFDRFEIVARSDHRYGRSAGSLRVGLGEHLDGIVIRTYPARQVAGTVTIAPGGAPCRDPRVALRSEVRQRWIELERMNTVLVADGVPPGAYTPQVSCRGFVQRAAYEPITVADRDVGGVVWEVTAGATLRGRVVTRGGVPLAGAWIYDEPVGGRIDKATRVRDDGSYELAGLALGAHRVSVRRQNAGVDHDDDFALDIGEPRVVEHDFVLAETGTIAGTTVDAEGRPVPDEDVEIKHDAADAHTSRRARSDDAGRFTVAALAPGEYHVSTAAATVRANRVATVKIVVAAKRSTIAGNVVDALGKPVSDALVVATSEARWGSDARSATRWLGGERPVLTAADGSFTLTGLAAGPHVVRAYRKGGGDAIAEHVATGSKIKLAIAATATIAGTVTARSGTPEDLVVRVDDDASGITRTEQFFGTQGRYAVADLPKGRYTVQWNAERGWKRADVALGAGEAKALDIVLDPLVSLTGRVVDLRARTPVAGIKVTAYASDPGELAGTAITDGTGRFHIASVSPGSVELRLAGQDPYPGATAVRSVDSTTKTFDVGDLPIVKARVTDDDPVGELGFDLDTSRDATRRRERIVRDIDPDGPSARSGLREGDVIVRVDGIDLRGPGFDHWDAAVTAPPGTKLVFELARGATVTVTLGRPAD